MNAADGIAHQTGVPLGWERFATIVHAGALEAFGPGDWDLDALSVAAFAAQGKIVQQENDPAAKRPDSRVLADPFWMRR